MHRLTHAVSLPLALLLVLGLVFLAGCGGGGGGGGEDPPTPPVPDPDPTLASIDPTQGSTGGGTPVTLAGTNFTAPATITIGGNPATAVTVVSATTITCTTPAGTTGVGKVVEVTTDAGSAVLLDAYRYYPPPTVTAANPPFGSIFGGMLATITGTGFADNTPGLPLVSVGGNPATGITVIDDTTLTCILPAHAQGNAGVIVTNLNGSGTLPGGILYFTPILAAEGGGNPTPGSYMLHAIQPATGIAYPIGTIGYGVTGMAFAADGTLYGTTAPGGAGGPRELIQIDPGTGAGTPIGNTDDSGATNYAVPDISFVGALLYGTDGPGGNTLNIDHNTGGVALVGANAVAGKGSAFASNSTGTSTWYMSSSSGTLYSVNVTTSTYTPGPMLGGGVTGGLMLGATYHNASLYAIESDGLGAWQLVTVNTGDGSFTSVGPLPPRVSAIASSTP